MGDFVPIRGKIAAVVDVASFIINVGANQGVSIGMLFRVAGRNNDIPDPDNPARVLKGISFIVGTIRATVVYDDFAFCTAVSEGTNPFLPSALRPVASAPRGLPIRGGEVLLKHKPEFGIGVGSAVVQIEPAKPVAAMPRPAKVRRL
jgi:hypothetical protein